MDDVRPPVVFDFDGTIADSFLAVLRELYMAVRHRPLPPEDVERLRHHSLLQALRQLQIPWWRALVAARGVRSRMASDMGTISPIQGIADVIRKLAETHELFILSSNDALNVRSFLELHGLAACFVDVRGDADPLRKAPGLRSLVREHQLNVKTAWYVGDQPWDVRAAHNVGMKAAAVTWGYSTEASLKQQHPEVVVMRASELLTLFSRQ